MPSLLSTATKARTKGRLLRLEQEEPNLGWETKLQRPEKQAEPEDKLPKQVLSVPLWKSWLLPVAPIFPPPGTAKEKKIGHVFH